MTSAQKQAVLVALAGYQKRLQRIVDGQHPYRDQTLRLCERREHADWQLEFLLVDLLLILPEDLRTQVQACLDLNAHIWSTEYQNVCDEAQKKLVPNVWRLQTNQQRTRGSKRP